MSLLINMQRLSGALKLVLFYNIRWTPGTSRRYITAVPKLTYASTQLLNIKSENPSADSVQSAWTFEDPKAPPGLMLKEISVVISS